MSAMIATLFGIGRLRPAPGTWGSLAALPLALLLHLAGGPWLLAAALIVVVAVGFRAAAQEIADSGEDDPGHVVIDEVAGQWVALLPVSVGAAHAGAAVTALWPGWIAAFLLFRLFDIWKPGPVGWADRQGGALGVMLDDLIAGLFAAVGVALLAALAHGVMGA
jgi:phosphatidylglycerophosphatase A